MSTVERALKKLRESREGEPPSGPIARVSEDLDSSPPGPGAVAGPSAAPTKYIELNLDALHDAGLLSPANRALAEQYRTIKQPLLRTARRTGSQAVTAANLVMVASALAGEGKTFTCVNLSLSLASEQDWEVLLVDADCRNPQLSKLMGVEKEPGLMDVLRNKNLDLSSAIMATNYPALTVLPMGTPDDHASELLASARMVSLCERLTTENPRRITVFDSSPLLLTTESSILAQHVGQIIVVVRANVTPQSAVVEAVHQLDETKAIGIVLNRASASANSMDYGAYSTHGHYAAGRTGSAHG